jgi:hypothetical protein
MERAEITGKVWPGRGWDRDHRRGPVVVEEVAVEDRVLAWDVVKEAERVQAGAEDGAPVAARVEVAWVEADGARVSRQISLQGLRATAKNQPSASCKCGGTF